MECFVIPEHDKYIPRVFLVAYLECFMVMLLLFPCANFKGERNRKATRPLEGDRPQLHGEAGVPNVALRSSGDCAVVRQGAGVVAGAGKQGRAHGLDGRPRQVAQRDPTRGRGR